LERSTISSTESSGFEQVDSNNNVFQWLEKWVQKRNLRVAESKNNKSKLSNNEIPDEECEYDDKLSVQSSDSNDEIIQISNNENFQNIYFLQGPTGCGKTSLVYSAAKKLSINVIEVNSSQNRSGSSIKKLFSEAAHSHIVGVNNKRDNFSESSSQNVETDIYVEAKDLNLILFDEVISYFHKYLLK
jgi:ATP-dependent Clp protease ATP-binding subunit ClpA